MLYHTMCLTVEKSKIMSKKLDLRHLAKIALSFGETLSAYK